MPTSAALGNTAAPLPRLRVDGAMHAFGAQTVLQGVSLVLFPGEIYGLLGPNGAGKSTLMKAICGRYALDRGSVRLDGADPMKSRAARRRIGFVPQEIALYGHLTVRENLAVFASLSGVRRADLAAVVTLALAETGLTSHADILCRALSGGYQRRLNIAASILHQPQLLVLDEPTVGIDIDAREAIHTVLRKLRARGTAILLTTHDLDQAEALADRIAIMADGRILLEGAPKTLLAAAFGSRVEVIAVVAKSTAQQADLLQSLGFVPTATPGNWVLLAEPEACDLKALSARLAGAGLSIKELRMRTPDLATLFVAALKQDRQ